MVFRNALSKEPAVREALSTAWPWRSRAASGCERLSTFVLDFSAFFAAFLAAFAAFFALLAFLAIWCGPRIVVARSWAALCMSQGPPIFKEPFFSLNHFLLWLRISRHQDEGLALSPTGFRSTVAPPPQGENAASNGKCSGLRQPFVRKRGKGGYLGNVSLASPDTKDALIYFSPSSILPPASRRGLWRSHQPA